MYATPARRLMLLCLVAALAVSMLAGTGCLRRAPTPVEPPPDPPVEPVTPPEEPLPPVEPLPTPQGNPLLYTLRVRSLTIRDQDGLVLAKARCTVPEIVLEGEHAGIAEINRALAESQQAFLNWVEENALEVARDDRAVRGAEFSFHVYESWADAQYNDRGIFSVLTDYYFYSGGAHPSSFMRADNYVVADGKRLSLPQVWGTDAETAMRDVFAVVAAQIEAQRGSDSFGYYDDYEEFYREYYDPDDFVITEAGLTLFYQPYTISPYAAGLPQFTVPFDELPETSVVKPTAQDKQAERDLHWSVGGLLERNHEVAFGMYFLGWLDMDTPWMIEYKPGPMYFRVTDPRFQSLAAVRNFLRATYAHTEVDALLAQERYVEIDGRLYGDFSKDGGMGYYLDWSDFRFFVWSRHGDTAEIAIVISGVHPGDYEPTTELIIARVVLVNRNWLLERMVY